MNTAVVKFNTLANAVRTAAQNHDLTIVRRRGIIRRIVGWIVVSAVLRTAYVNAFPSFGNTKAQAVSTNVIFRNIKQLAQVTVREAVLLRRGEFVCRKLLTRMFRSKGKNFLLFINQFLHFLNEVNLDLGKVMQLLYRSTLTQGFVHDELTLWRCFVEHLNQIIKRLFVEILNET